MVEVKEDILIFLQLNIVNLVNHLLSHFLGSFDDLRDALGGAGDDDVPDNVCELDELKICQSCYVEKQDKTIGVQRGGKKAWTDIQEAFHHLC